MGADETTSLIPSRKRHARGQVDEGKKKKIILSAVATTVAAIGAWYHEKHFCKSDVDTEPFSNDIVGSSAEDPLTGQGAETTLDADESMSNKEVHGEADEETDTTGSDRSSGSHDMEEALSTDAQKRKGQSTSSVELPHIKKVESKNELAFVVKEMSDSLQEFLRSSVKRLDVKEVIDELKGVPDLDRKQRLKAINWLVENETQFSVVKNLPIDEKKDYILMFMP